MRKFLIALLLVLITYTTTSGGCGCDALAANIMTAQVSYFTITDDIAPYMQNLTPAEGTAIDPKNFVFSFDIVDDLSGIDLPTVVVNSAIGTVTKTETPIANGYHVEITIDGLGYGQEVTIDISADDNT